MVIDVSDVARVPWSARFFSAPVRKRERLEPEGKILNDKWQKGKAKVEVERMEAGREMPNVKLLMSNDKGTRAHNKRTRNTN